MNKIENEEKIHELQRRKQTSEQIQENVSLSKEMNAPVRSTSVDDTLKEITIKRN